MSFRNSYSLIDRALHRVAFATGTAQLGIADIEERMFRRELEPITIEKPVLITALPRAGTTILLELLHRTPTFATHTYRDVPFTLCPMMWDKVSGPFRKTDTPRERAHKDGIQISLDSPEAFEEAVWMQFWPEHYKGSEIRPWDKCDKSEFVEFLTAHMRKIIALRARSKPSAQRYASKNNLNIARIPHIWQAVPEAIVIVPFRDPIQHASSLLRQHQNFSAMHAEDKFARRYMAGIGHFDFGHNLKPIDFDNWYSSTEGHDPNQLEFWLKYWLAVHRHILHNQDKLVLIAFEALGEAVDTGPLAERILVDPAELRAEQHIFRATKTHEVDTSSIPAHTQNAVRELYHELARHSVL